MERGCSAARGGEEEEAGPAGGPMCVASPLCAHGHHTCCGRELTQQLLFIRPPKASVHGAGVKHFLWTRVKNNIQSAYFMVHFLMQTQNDYSQCEEIKSLSFGCKHNSVTISSQINPQIKGKT